MNRALLVIDGDPAQRQVLCGALKDRLGYDPRGVASGQEAARHMCDSQVAKPDAILLDVSTTTNGCNIISSLRQITPQLPIVVLVRYGDYETAMQMLAGGALDFLSKPAAIERIGTTLKNALLLRDAQYEVQWLRRRNTDDTLADSMAARNEENAALLSFMNGDGNVRRMEEIEAEAIRFAMRYYEGRMTEVARRLGIGRSTLYRKLNDLGDRQEAVA